MQKQQPSHSDKALALQSNESASFPSLGAAAARHASLRRWISSSSGDDDNGCAAKADAPKHTNTTKKRRRVAFETPVVGMVHPHPEQPREPKGCSPDDESSVNSGEVNVSSPPPSLWYTSAELGAMKRRAKRLCAINHDLEYALDDAYNHHPDGLNGGGKDEGTVLVSSFDVQLVSGDLERDAAASTTTQTPLRSPGLASGPSALVQDQIAASEAAERRLLEIPFFLEQRGMERWSSRRGALSRCLTALHVKTEVFVTQAQHTTAEVSKSSAAAAQQKCALLDARQRRRRQAHDHALEIAHVAARASAPAVRFAQMLGRIDAWIAREDDVGVGGFKGSDQPMSEV